MVAHGVWAVSKMGLLHFDGAGDAMIVSGAIAVFKKLLTGVPRPSRGR